MKPCCQLLIPCCCLAFSIANASLKSEIDQLLEKSPQPAHYGVLVENVKTHRVLYHKNSKQLYTPASVAKLLTATAALAYLGEDFRYETELLGNGKDFIIRFDGDPQLSSSDLDKLLKTLKSKGVKRISGKVQLDTSAFDNTPYPPGWLWDDLSYNYAAPLTTAIVDRNTFILWIAPAAQAGRKPELSVDIPDGVVQLDNQLKTTQRSSKLCPLTIYSDMSNRFTLKGCLNSRWGRQLRHLALRDSTPYVKAIIQESLAKNGIVYRGKITFAKANKTYKVIATHRSKPLRKLVKTLLKKSDNLIADSLLKTIGHTYYRQPGSWQNGILAIQKILGKPTGINFDRNLIDDGAGLSRYDLLSPQDLVSLLNYVYSQPSLRKTLLAALPIGGFDGTLVGRMSFGNKKSVYAKTGSMTGISSLSGYIYTKHLGVLSFAIIANGFVGKHRPFRNIEDAICERLINYRGSKHVNIRGHRKSGKA